MGKIPYSVENLKITLCGNDSIELYNFTCGEGELDNFFHHEISAEVSQKHINLTHTFSDHYKSFRIKLLLIRLFLPLSHRDSINNRRQSIKRKTHEAIRTQILPRMV